MFTIHHYVQVIIDKNLPQKSRRTAQFQQKYPLQYPLIIQLYKFLWHIIVCRGNMLFTLHYLTETSKLN